MKIRVHPADLWGCGHYRLIWPAEALKAAGHDVEIVRPSDESGVRGVTIGGRLVDVQLEHDADVWVFQRPTHVAMRELIGLLRARGKTVVVDMDDDLSCIHPKNTAFAMLHPRYSPTNNWQHAQEACHDASLVTVSTPELLRRYGRVANARILRNCVPAWFLNLRPAAGQVRVWGWAGALHSHPDDLPLLGGVVQQLARRGHDFKIIGYTEGTGRALGLDADPIGTGRVPFDDWADALTQLRVGVAPLADTKFNRSKSWLKPLEYAAVGVPWVGSELGEYAALHKLGAGRVVRNRPRDWVTAVERLLTDEAHWTEESQRCRAVAASCTIEEHAWRWLETWETAYQLDHGSRSTVVA